MKAQLKKGTVNVTPPPIKRNVAIMKPLGPPMQFHELADFFPRLEGKEFEELKADIQKNGLREPIITLDGKILDGRNRYLAARALNLNLKPENFKAYDGKGNGDARAYVVSKNIRRRHLNATERAKLVLEILGPAVEKEADDRKKAGKTLASNEAKGKSSQKLAEAANTSRSTIERVKAAKKAKANPAAAKAKAEKKKAATEKTPNAVTECLAEVKKLLTQLERKHGISAVGEVLAGLETFQKRVNEQEEIDGINDDEKPDDEEDEEDED